MVKKVKNDLSWTLDGNEPPRDQKKAGISCNIVFLVYSYLRSQDDEQPTPNSVFVVSHWFYD